MRTVYTATLDNFLRQARHAEAFGQRVDQAARDVGAAVFQDEVVLTDAAQREAFERRLAEIGAAGTPQPADSSPSTN